MSSDGPQTAFVNSHGFVHDTITFRSLTTQPFLMGRPETANSWFPGYAWIITYCPCGNHLGTKSNPFLLKNLRCL